MKVSGASWLKVDANTRPGHLCLTAGWIIDLVDGRYIWVPRGFWSDGASVPNVLWPLLRANPLRLLCMAVAHDYSVRVGATIRGPGYLDIAPFTFEASTGIAEAVASYYGVGRWDRLKIRGALELARASYWKKRAVGWAPV